MVKKAAGKSAGETTTPTAPSLVPQPHGGALLTGGVPGNAGGTGRPPSAIRASLREDFDRRRVILNEIADDKEAPRSERIKAVETIGKFGLGNAKELTVEHVRERLAITLGILREELTEDAYERIRARLKPVWA